MQVELSALPGLLPVGQAGNDLRFWRCASATLFVGGSLVGGCAENRGSTANPKNADLPKPHNGNTPLKKTCPWASKGGGKILEKQPDPGHCGAT